ncbi:MAG: hypothetical protein J7M25_17855 [Deltaproteobacteria bacterium]|nr:hypothetical protein [Deltaproteobacteria bacterium]
MKHPTAYRNAIGSPPIGKTTPLGPQSGPATHEQNRRQTTPLQPASGTRVPRSLVVFILSTAVGTMLLTLLALSTNPILSENQRTSQALMYHRLGQCYLSSNAEQRPLCESTTQALISGPSTQDQIVFHGLAVALIEFVVLVSFLAWVLAGIFLGTIRTPKRALRWAMASGSVAFVGTAAIVGLGVMKPAFLAVGLTQAMGLVATTIQFWRTKDQTVCTTAKTVPPQRNLAQPTPRFFAGKTSA